MDPNNVYDPQYEMAGEIDFLRSELAAVKAELKRKDELVADVLAKTGLAVERMMADGRAANVNEVRMFNALDALRAFYAALTPPKAEKPWKCDCGCHSFPTRSCYVCETSGKGCREKHRPTPAMPGVPQEKGFCQYCGHERPSHQRRGCLIINCPCVVYVKPKCVCDHLENQHTRHSPIGLAGCASCSCLSYEEKPKDTEAGT